MTFYFTIQPFALATLSLYFVIMTIFLTILSSRAYLTNAAFQFVSQWPVYISQFCLSFNSESLSILNLHLTSVLFSLNSEFISHMKFFLRHLRIARNAKLRNVNEILIRNCCNNLFLFLWQKQASIQHIFMTGAIADISIETLFMYLINWCYCFLTII